MHRHDQKENSRVDLTQLESVFLINYHFIFKGTLIENKTRVFTFYNEFKYQIIWDKYTVIVMYLYTWYLWVARVDCLQINNAANCQQLNSAGLFIKYKIQSLNLPAFIVKCNVTNLIEGPAEKLAVVLCLTRLIKCYNFGTIFLLFIIYKMLQVEQLWFHHRLGLDIIEKI